MTNDLTPALLDQLTGATQLSESAQTTARSFARWRQEHAPLAPTDEKLLLAWLLNNEHWTYNTANNHVKSLDRYYRRTTGTTLSGRLVKIYLTHKQHTHDQRLELTPALLIEDAQAIADQHETSTDPTVAALRAGLVLLRSLADPTQPLTQSWETIQDLRLTTDPTGAHLHTSDHHIDLPLDPAAALVWREHLLHLNDRELVPARTRTAARIVGIDIDRPTKTLTDAQWDSYWRALDQHDYRTLRDLAYLLVGLNTARRHAELRRLELHHIHEHDHGYAVQYQDNKRKKTLNYGLTHTGTADTPCPPGCAACALEALITYERDVQHRTTGPVFATRYAGRTRPMTRRNAGLRIKKLAGPGYSTRSLRAGAATSAWDRGMSLTQIANTITQHGTLAEADKYIRKSGAPGRTLQLRIGPPR